MKVVIMAGGQGTRFWPWSVKDRPKQFLSLMGEETMLQQTYNRFHKWLPAEKIFIVTSKEYVSLVKEQIDLIDDNQIIIEPLQRDTGPCIALTALNFLKSMDDEPFAAVPADHYIPEDDSLLKVFTIAEDVANRDFAIVTLGIKPTRPETGYGYIQTEVDQEPDNNVLTVKSFIEKPSLEKAQRLLRNPGVYWNSGIFMWKPSTVSYYMKKFHPEIWIELEHNWGNLDTIYSYLPKISVDYAILERADLVYTIPSSFYWDDVGNWSAWDRLNQTEEEDNAVMGNIHLLSTKNCIIKSENQETIVIGVQDLIIASTEDGLLICHKSQEQKIKEVLQRITNNKRI
ncbi:mannose-1-phosphate guanylyltransferase [Priestia megaterium]|uniref:mannose-1-phosphate guanylyltransferase n=1 Tax=Priestia megaterium TaxID=1404 RepID=UPI0023DC87F1|nr:sugar phosphate nucleotidyltransferase [Priestia megaterium]MDF2054913.1 sugar phosphate nucleotidyltransferase [Priestia megaterium]MDF2063037.1 sugar phosphate nucleotidyltransferase [Priestia megaterium]